MVFSLVETKTTKNNLMNETKYAIGADLRITTLSKKPISFAQNLTRDFPVLKTTMPVLYSGGGLADFSIRMIGVDPTQYKTIAFWTSSSLVSPTFDEALDSLAADPEGVIISDYVTKALCLSLGDQIRTRWKEDYQTFKIVGIMRSMPGFGEAEPTSESSRKSFGFQEDRFIIVNKDLLSKRGVDETTTFFAGLKEGVNTKEVCQQISYMPEVEAVYSPETFDVSEVDIHRYLYMQGVTGALILQFLVTTVIGVVVLTLYLDYMVSGRSVQYAVMRAVGATRKNITALIFIESVEVIVLSLVIGSVLGTAYSIFLFDLLMQIFPFRSLVPYVFVIPVSQIIVGFGVVLLAMILGSYLPARKAGRTDVARVLRNL
jgi:putative ABC transport system permease protein